MTKQFFEKTQAASVMMLLCRSAVQQVIFFHLQISNPNPNPNPKSEILILNPNPKQISEPDELQTQ